ncbi:shikimate kinase [Ideonella sp.]|uniref:shikimate kinase n=1 Tax=Ideonella sp. TaxID=1929293 RepID=UPI0037C01DB0
MCAVISLVGMPGCGKSTVGRQLARALGLRFLDSDSEIESELGESIRSFFDREGEEAFRPVEERVIARLTAGDGLMLATGGGAVLRAANRQALRAGGNHVIYLRSTPEELIRRLRHDAKRPLLQVADPLKRLRDLYAQRDPLYRETAEFVIDTGRHSLATLVNLIAMQVEMAGWATRTTPPVQSSPNAGQAA